MPISLNGDGVVSGVSTLTNPSEITVGTGASVFSPSANTLALGTNGSERVRIDSSGNFGVGTTSPAMNLEVSGNQPNLRINTTTTGYTGLEYSTNGTTDGGIYYNGTDDRMEFYTADTTGNPQAVIDSSGRLLVGTSTNITSNLIQSHGTGSGAIGVGRFAANAFGPEISFYKSRNGTVGSNTIVQNGDYLGANVFHGNNGSGYLAGATIAARVDGTPGASDMPTRLEFSTTSATGSTPTTHVLLDKFGHLNLITNSSQASSFSRDAKIRGINGTSVTNFDFANMSGGSYTDTIGFITCETTNAVTWNFLRMYSGRRYDNASGDQEFQFRGDGNAYADNSWNGGGADYAEYFEWSDSNPDAEDRRGISVVLDGDKIREAVAGEDPIGVISGNPSVVGDADIDRWKGKYLRDDFGTYLREAFTAVEWQDENGETQSYESDHVPDGVIVPDDAVTITVDNNGDTLTRRVLNPDYDPDVTYVPREERPEWDAVGLMGKLRIRKGQVTGARWIKMRDISDSVEEWLVR